MKRRHSIISIFLLVSLLASCGGTTEPEVTDQQTTDSEPETTKYADSVPELNFDGYEFRTIEQDSTRNSFFSEEETGEYMNDAIYKRNTATEERFGVKFAETVKQAYDVLDKTVSNSVMSGTDEFDLVFGQMFNSAKSAMNGGYVDWNTIPYVDFEKPWYTKSIQEASVGGNLLLIESDLCVMYTEQTWLMAYNKTKADEYGVENLYSLVDDGKWTVDKLNTIVTGMYNDLNGDGQRDKDDFYGIGANQDGCQLAAFYYANNVRLANVGNDLSVRSEISSEKSVDVLTKLAKLFNENDGSIRKTDNIATATDQRTKLFVDGTVLFAPLQVSDLVVEEMRSLKSEYGVLPLPKYDETQKEYYTVVDGGANIMFVPITTNEKQREIVGAIVESMSALSYRDVIPTYCGMALEQKGTRDEESIAMLRKILDSRIIDFAYLYDGFNGWVMKLPALVLDSSSISSKIAKDEAAVEKYYNDVVTYLTENAE